MNLNTEQYFSTVPYIDCPRSVFDRSYTMKTTLNVNKLYPIFIDEMLPGDSFRVTFQAFGRILNPLVVPVMDELYFETLWFKCPNRLLWSHWVNFCGEQDNPGDSTDYVIPTINSGDTGFALDSLADHFCIPINVPNGDVNALPFRMYNKVYNEWFRDENLINSVPVNMTDSDLASNYTVLTSAKMHDYFTSCLPFSQKGDPVTLPLGTTCPVRTTELDHITPGDAGSQYGLVFRPVDDSINVTGQHNFALGGNVAGTRTTAYFCSDSIPSSHLTTGLYPSNLVAQLSQATGASISDFRFAIKLQQMREINARSGTRYIEWIKAHFGVDSPDARLQRSEFLGSTREMIDINTVVQTSSTDSTSPQGNLTAFGVISHHGAGFSTSATEHSYVMGIARIRHNPVYQQGLDKIWSRSTLLDFYLPIFNGISEQPVKNSEIYWQGKNVFGTTKQYKDDEAFGFQEAWAEYRYKPSKISGLLNSNANLSLDVYHLAQNFSQLPLLNQSFIEESVPLDRVLSITSSENTAQFIFDFRFNVECARPMPIRNIPAGLYTRF